MPEDNLRQLIAAELDRIPIVDTHEHLRTVEERAPERMDLKKIMMGYFAWNVLGDPKREHPLWDLPLDQWWESVAPELDQGRAVAFYRYVLPAFHDLYDFTDEELTDENWRALSDRITDAYRDPGWFNHVLQERTHITHIVHDRYWLVGAFEPQADFLHPVARIDAFLVGYNREARDHDDNNARPYADSLGLSTETFDDYLHFVEVFIRRSLELGAVGLKCAIAYDRGLRFERVSKEKAAEAMNRTSEELTPDQICAFQDYVVHFALQRAQEHGVPFQFHTGLGSLIDSSPLRLRNLVEDYPNVRFDLFHGGYPWTGEVAAMALCYPNVYLDLCWLPLISPTAAVRALHEWLEVAPGSRIVWGGDCWTVEEVYGAAHSVKAVIAQVLAEKVESGYIGEEVAIDLAWRILRRNALDLYALSA